MNQRPKNQPKRTVSNADDGHDDDRPDLVLVDRRERDLVGNDDQGDEPVPAGGARRGACDVNRGVADQLNFRRPVRRGRRRTASRKAVDGFLRHLEVALGDCRDRGVGIEFTIGVCA